MPFKRIDSLHRNVSKVKLQIEKQFLLPSCLVSSLQVSIKVKTTLLGLHMVLFAIGFALLLC